MNTTILNYEQSPFFSTIFLQQVREGKILGPFSPFLDADKQAVNKYIKKIVNSIKRDKTIEVNWETDMFQMDFVSYTQVTVTKKIATDDKFIVLWLCELAPYWCFPKHISGGEQNLTYAEFWEYSLQNIIIVLSSYNYQFLSPNILNQTVVLKEKSIHRTTQVHDCLFYYR